MAQREHEWRQEREQLLSDKEAVRADLTAQREQVRRDLLSECESVRLEMEKMRREKDNKIGQAELALEQMRINNQKNIDSYVFEI